MLLQRPPVILGPADQLDEVAATKSQLEGGQLIQDAAQGPHISLVVVWHSSQNLLSKQEKFLYSDVYYLEF